MDCKTVFVLFSVHQRCSDLKESSNIASLHQQIVACDGVLEVSINLSWSML